MIVDVGLACTKGVVKLTQDAGSNAARCLAYNLAISGRWDDICSLDYLGTLSILGQITICKVWCFTDEIDGVCSTHTGVMSTLNVSACKQPYYFTPHIKQASYNCGHSHCNMVLCKLGHIPETCSGTVPVLAQRSMD